MNPNDITKQWWPLVEALCKKHGIVTGIAVTLREDLDIAGYLQPVKGGYVVVLNTSLDTCERAMIIGHEICHVQQMVCGDLKLVPGGYEWKGEWFPFEAMPYNQRPHEIEARKREQPALQTAFNLGLI